VPAIVLPGKNAAIVPTRLAPLTACRLSVRRLLALLNRLLRSLLSLPRRSTPLPLTRRKTERRCTG
jgi:hypothetical protein